MREDNIMHRARPRLYLLQGRLLILL